MRLYKILPVVLALSAALTSGRALAQAGADMVRVELGASGPTAQTLALPRNKSAIVELPVDARDVLVSNPAVADVVLRTPRRIYVLGVGAGQTDAVFFDAAGRQILNLDIRVDQDTGALAQTIRRVIPRSNVQVEAVNDSVILTGMVASLSDADKAVRIAERFVPKPELVLNMLGIAGKDQVMLKVRVVEMQRTVVKQLGFNLNAVLNQIGEPQFLLGNFANFATNGDFLGGFTGGYKLDTTKQPILRVFDPETEQWYDVVDRNNPIAVPKDSAGDPGLNQAESTVAALERVGLARTLAEPNLTAVSGEAAKFLAGGEFPVPVSQDNDGGISVEFKPFGVGLAFTPVVLSEGRISLKISTEVSELSSKGAFTVGGGTSRTPVLSIPSLSVRRAETSVELPSGGGMMIAGLLQETTKQSIDSVPGLMNLPVLGGLLRSRDFQSGETELVIIVTPYLVQPTSPSKLQTPADGMQIASDAETVLFGRLNQAVRPGAAPPQGRYAGPAGWAID